MVLRLVDHFNSTGTSTIFTSLQSGIDNSAELGISSLMDTWMVVRNARTEAELERRFFIVKSRGMAHSAQVRRLEITSNGTRLGSLPGAAELPE